MAEFSHAALLENPILFGQANQRLCRDLVRNPEICRIPHGTREPFLAFQMPAAFIRQHCRFSDGQWLFHGPQTTNLWGEPLPLSNINNNYHHYGNPPESNAPGTEVVLVNGLMNGVRFLWGTRYRVNLLDLAIAKDCGVALLPHHTFAGPGRVAIEPMADGVSRLIWDSIPLGNYAVEYRDTLTETWRALDATNILTSPLGTVRIEDLSPVLPWQRYYRVRLHP